MLDLSVDVDELSCAIAAAVGRRYRLVPLKVKCTYPVFRGESDGESAVFVKVGTREEWIRTHDLLKSLGDCGLFARLLTEAPIEHHGHVVFVTEWRESKTVFPEDMSVRQAESFVAGCVKLSEALRGAGGALGAMSTDEPEWLYGELTRYVSRHPVAGRLLNGLAAIPVEERTFGSRPTTICHGDFHSKNFGFVGDEFAAVYDFDKLMLGLACGDFVNALVERFSCLGLSRAARRRLKEMTRRMIARAPWPREEMAIACNVIRLQFAVRRIRKHPRSAWIALDVIRRDRRIREFLESLAG